MKTGAEQDGRGATPRLSRRALAGGALAIALSRRASAQVGGSSGYGMPRVSLPVFPGDAISSHVAPATGWVQLLSTTPILNAQPDGAIHGGLAMTWALSRDRLQLDLGIRPDVLFADATMVGAADVAASIVEAEERHAGTVDAWRWENIDAVSVEEGNVVRLALSQPDASIPALLSSFWVPVYPASWIERGRDREQGSFPPASGGFQLEDTSAERWLYRRHAGYFQPGRPRLAGVLCTATPPSIPRTTELVTGEVDLMIDVPLLDVPMLREDPGITLVGGATNRLCVLVLNLDRPVIADPRVRRLLSMAIDRQALVEAATANEAVPASALVPAEHWAGLDYTIDPADPGDVRDQLAALGEPPGVELRLVAGDADASLANACVLLQEQLAWAGIALSLDLLDDAAMGEQMAQGGWDLLMTHTPFWRDPHELIRPLVTSDGSQNRGGYANPRVDYLANLAARSRNPTYRAGFYQTIQEIVATDVPVIPLHFPNYYDAMSTRLRNYPFLPPVSAAAMCQVTMAKPEPVEFP